MPRKIRELIRDLEAAGFINRGKGSHRNFIHPRRQVRYVVREPRGGREAISGEIDWSHHRGVSQMKDSARYVKIVEWSDEDQCFVGSCPGLFFGGCHGENELTVFSEL